MTKDGYTGRLSAMGIRQAQFANRLGVTTVNVRKMLSSENKRYTAIIELLELLSDEQRRQWLSQKSF
jgi:hypothetical protein